MRKKNRLPLRLEVKHYHSPDIEHIETWKPDNNHVYYHLEMEIGLEDEEAADLYFVILATSSGIAEAQQRRKTAATKPAACMIVLDQYSWEHTVSRIQSILDSIPIYDRQDSLEQLLHYFNYEYETFA